MPAVLDQQVSDSDLKFIRDIFEQFLDQLRWHLIKA